MSNLPAPEMLASAATLLAHLEDDTLQMIDDLIDELRADPAAYLIVSAEGEIKVERVMSVVAEIAGEIERGDGLAILTPTASS